MRAYVLATFGLMAMALPPAAAVSTTASADKGPKVIEIDEAGNVRTTTGKDIGRTSPKTDQRDPDTITVPRDGNAAMSICDPRYRWLPSGVSNDTVVRARAFYGDVTRNYERAQRSARARGATADRQTELEYWAAYKKFLDSVLQSERKVVERGISPRLTWWCGAPPVIVKSTRPPPTPLGQ